MEDNSDMTPEQRARSNDEQELLQLMPDKSVSTEWLAHRLGWDMAYVNMLLRRLNNLGYVRRNELVICKTQRRTDMNDDTNEEHLSLDEYKQQIAAHTPGQLMATMACSGYSHQKSGEESPTMERFQETFDRYHPQFVEHCDQRDIVAQLCHVPFGEHLRLGHEAAVSDTAICNYPAFVLSVWPRDEEWSNEDDDQEKESPK